MKANRSPRLNPSASSAQRGFVLIVTLWMMVILGVMLTNLGYQVRVEAAVQRRALDVSQLRWAARGLIHQASAQVRAHVNDEFHSPTADWWSDETLYKDQPFGPVRVSLLQDNHPEQPLYGLQDQESRLNINKARPEHLMGLGFSSVVAEAIVLFRLELEDELQSTADTNDTKQSEDDSEQPLVQGPIRSLRELLAVEGVSEELLFAARDGEPPLAHFLTPLSSGKVNINSASATVLTALGLDEAQLESVLEQRQETAFSSVEALFSTLGGDQSSKKWQRLRNILDVRSHTFRLLAQARIAQRSQPYHIEALLASGGDQLRFVRWREY